MVPSDFFRQSDYLIADPESAAGEENQPSLPVTVTTNADDADSRQHHTVNPMLSNTRIGCFLCIRSEFLLGGIFCGKEYKCILMMLAPYEV
ncbi:hypothetical protein RP20_CCG013744 [Aedes albopictus]|nr:hypothetical protein RP20_CCG013744 [Aedes albopictus]